MTDSTLAIFIIWCFLFVYSILGSIDFGAGFWAMVFGQRADTNAADIANRYLSPSWKVTNVFLVLLVVALVGFFPLAMPLLGTLLVTPVCLVLILLTLRSTFMVYSHMSPRYVPLLRFVSGITGLLIPGLLITLLPVTLGGFVEMTDGHPSVLTGKLLMSRTEYAHLAFGIATELFLSALFLADFAREAEDEATYRVYRHIAVAIGPLTLLTGILAAVSMVPEAHWLVERMRERASWFMLSAAAFAIGYSALWWKAGGGRTGVPRAAVVCVIIQYGLASFGYGSAHLPYIIYPHLTVEQGITNAVMFRSLLVGYAAGTLVLVPVFIWFWRLFLKDKRYLKQE
ncbi:cytochrome d ubiquinol oxidase subunit II [Paenibacillus beijingensis]|uniref:Membrane protein n=1 Tax=Paenibacillus beijingensis TaxID=1126833 RepID=A0A0D5NPX8_9BACL|nr:cytochrome d ubiquinol oxidase subunit II [Paenibacillus beijingensis]AJY77311.1 membrane protein [Paenibacillus beijingensis]